MYEIDALKTGYRELNREIKEKAAEGEDHFVLKNINGHRYLGTGIDESIIIDIHGVPGSDLAAFSNQAIINVFGNAQELIGNTMNSGEIVVHGHATDVTGFGMRGGKILVRDKVGYRVGIHMKSYADQSPLLVVGGTAGDFLGEYMAGGTLIVLGLNRDESEPIAGDYIGTGMHGGEIFLRGRVEEHQLGKEVSISSINDLDNERLKKYVTEYCDQFDIDLNYIMDQEFIKLVPISHRPYGRLYVG